MSRRHTLKPIRRRRYERVDGRWNLASSLLVPPLRLGNCVFLRLGSIAVGVMSLCCLVPASPAAAQPVAMTLKPEDYSEEAKLATLLWAQTPEVIEARGEAGAAASEVTRARKLPNPTLDFTWGTIPIGNTNPPDLADPIFHVPNYNVGISELIELAKRGPRQAATVAELETARAKALAVLSTRFFDLLETIGHIAQQQLRAAVIDGQVKASERLLALDRARAQKGEIAVIDADRSAVELNRLQATRDAARTALEMARADCVAIIAAQCPPFASGKAARRFLRDGAGRDLPSSWSSEIEQQRPDIAALDAALRAANERATLARHRSIPDVTLRLGYTYDTFLAAGNQQQSLNLGFQVPLPVADQGQADLQAATAALARAFHARQSLVESGRLALELAVRQRDLIADRGKQMTAALAKARELRDSLESVARAGAASQVDVLLARRAYQDLLLERIELDADGYTTALHLREAAAAFPKPQTPEEELRS